MVGLGGGAGTAEVEGMDGEPEGSEVRVIREGPDERDAATPDAELEVCSTARLACILE